jgi:tRNA uridine 5-carbamoylmethylation protein Kti12
MPNLTVLVGLPGSGKSTYLKSVLKEGDFVYSTDDYIESVANSLGKTYNDVFQSQFKEANSFMNSALTEAISAGRDVFWDQTNMTSKKRISIIRKFPRLYKTHCVVFELPKTPENWNELEKRLNFRVGKTIPQTVINSMYDSYDIPSVSEGFDSIKFIDSFKE